MADSFQIFVRSLASKWMVLWVHPSHTIADVKVQIIDRMGWIFTTPRDVRLVTGVKDLNDERTLSDYNIQEHACLWTLVRVRGGMQGGFDDGEALDFQRMTAPILFRHFEKDGPPNPQSPFQTI